MYSIRAYVTLPWCRVQYYVRLLSTEFPNWEGGYLYTISHQKRYMVSAFRIRVLVFWLFGLVIGLAYAVYAYDKSDSFLYAFSYSRVTFWGLAFVSVFPLLFVSILLWYGQTLLAILLIGIKSVIFSFSSQFLVLTFSSAGWLVHIVLMFTDFISVFLLLLFTYQYDRAYRRAYFCRSLLYVAIILIFVCIDYCAIKPFIITLLNK